MKLKFYLLVLLAVSLLIVNGQDAAAQKKQRVADIFTFSIVKKTPAHPFYGMGEPSGYAVNGVEGDTLYIIRDSTYAIDFDTLRGTDIPAFYTWPIGGSLNIYEDWRAGTYYSENHIYIRADEDTPDTLYYGHVDHAYFGGTFVIVDSLTTSVDHRAHLGSTLASRVYPHPLRYAATLEFRPESTGAMRVQIVDLAGRVVREWSESGSAGSNTRVHIDRGSLGTGLYFYRVLGAESGDDVITTGSFHIQ